MFFLFTKVDSISTTELEQKLKQNIQLIDVRTAGEFRRGHIKNAKNIPLNEIGSFTPVNLPQKNLKKEVSMLSMFKVECMHGEVK